MSKSDLCRFGVTMEKDLLKKIDELVKREGYSSRSDYLRRIARKAVNRAEFEKDDQPAIGTLTLLYEHQTVNLGHELTKIQHSCTDIITSSLHVHVSPKNCLEILILRGHSGRIKHLANELKRLRGVKFSDLSIAGSDVETYQ